MIEDSLMRLFYFSIFDHLSGWIGFVLVEAEDQYTAIDEFVLTDNLPIFCGEIAISEYNREVFYSIPQNKTKKIKHFYSKAEVQEEIRQFHEIRNKLVDLATLSTPSDKTKIN